MKITLLNLLSGLLFWISPSLLAQTGVQPADITVSGRVLDATGAAVVGAHVSLSLVEKPAVLTAVTGSDGGFSIAIPDPGPFHLAVTAQGFAVYETSGEIKGRASITLPDITLTIAAVSTEVQVPADSTKIAIEQVRAEEKQRILGVVPNYYVSYNQDTVLFIQGKSLILRGGSRSIPPALPSSVSSQGSDRPTTPSAATARERKDTASVTPPLMAISSPGLSSATRFCPLC